MLMMVGTARVQIRGGMGVSSIFCRWSGCSLDDAFRNCGRDNAGPFFQHFSFILLEKSVNDKKKGDAERKKLA